jgi:hypothetical protein
MARINAHLPLLWIRIAVIERYPRERDEDLGTRRT